MYGLSSSGSVLLCNMTAITMHCTETHMRILWAVLHFITLCMAWEVGNFATKKNLVWKKRWIVVNRIPGWYSDIIFQPDTEMKPWLSLLYKILTIVFEVHVWYSLASARGRISSASHDKLSYFGLITMRRFLASPSVGLFAFPSAKFHCSSSLWNLLDAPPEYTLLCLHSHEICKIRPFTIQSFYKMLAKKKIKFFYFPNTHQDLASHQERLFLTERFFILKTRECRFLTRQKVTRPHCWTLYSVCNSSSSTSGQPILTEIFQQIHWELLKCRVVLAELP